MSAFQFEHVHVPYPTDRSTEAQFGWFGEYLAVNEEGRLLTLYRCPGVESGRSDPDFVSIGDFGPQPCQAFAFPQRMTHGHTKEMALLTDEGDVRRYALTYNNPPHLIETLRADEGVSLNYTQSGDALMVGCRSGLIKLFAIGAQPGGTRMMRQVSSGSLLSVVATTSGIIVARDAAARAHAFTGVDIKDGRFKARGATVESIHDHDIGLPSDFDVYCCDAQPSGHQVIFGGLGNKAYLLKLDSQGSTVAEGETPNSELRVASVQVVFTKLRGGYVRYAHYVSNNRFVLGDRNSLEVYGQAADGSVTMIDAFDFGSDHTAIACRAHSSQRFYMLTAPHPVPLTAEVAD